VLDELGLVVERLHIKGLLDPRESQYLEVRWCDIVIDNKRCEKVVGWSLRA